MVLVKEKLWSFLEEEGNSSLHGIANENEIVNNLKAILNQNLTYDRF